MNDAATRPSAPPPPPPLVARALDVWHRIEVNLAVAAFSLIALILIYDVLEREFVAPVIRAFGFDASWMTVYGSQKFATYLLIIGAFTGIGIATWTGAQLVPKVAFRVAPASWNTAVNRAADLFTACFLFGAAYFGWIFVQGSFDLGLKSSGALSFQIWPVQAAVPFGFASAALRYLAFAIWPGARPAEAGEGTVE